MKLIAWCGSQVFLGADFGSKVENERKRSVTFIFYISFISKRHINPKCQPTEPLQFLVPVAFAAPLEFKQSVLTFVTAKVLCFGSQKTLNVIIFMVFLWQDVPPSIKLILDK